jgi:hypothetical protein
MEHKPAGGSGSAPSPELRSFCQVVLSGANGPAGLQPPLEGEHVVLAVAAVPTQGPHGHQPAAGGQAAKAGQGDTESVGGLGGAHHPNVVHQFCSSSKVEGRRFRGNPSGLHPSVLRNVGFSPTEEHG